LAVVVASTNHGAFYLASSFQYLYSSLEAAFLKALNGMHLPTIHQGCTALSLLRRGLHEVSGEGKVSAQGVMGRAK
jgi:hypothetical protein